MTCRLKNIFCLTLLLAVLAGTSDAAARLPIELIKLPPGFHIGLYAEGVPNARSLTVSPKGTVFVGSRKGDQFYALIDRDQDQYAETVLALGHGLRAPNGVAFHGDDLYVAEVSRIWRFPAIEGSLPELPTPELVRGDFPTETWHGWKFIGFGPDGKLYIPVGAPCNACERPDPRFASIMRMNPDGNDLEIFAKGVRNTVGFDWDPETGELWFTDNGRDELGDNRPPDELNHARREGLHFGFPYCHGGDIPDPLYGKARNCDEFEPPAQKLGPHVASLGVRFYDGEMFPPEYRGQMFIAEHGSWNRSNKIGYRISLVRVNEQRKAVSYEPFAAGWLQGERTWGRPVDVAVMPDGALLVSDDHAGAVYRIWYEPETAAKN